MEDPLRDPGGFVTPHLEGLPPADLCDPVLEAYKKDVDRSLLRENLKLTPEERLLKHQAFVGSLEGLRRQGARCDPASGRGGDPFPRT
jgi:hypothetical protein